MNSTTTNMDELLIKRCNEFTHEALKNNIKIDRICMFVKDYQRKYLSLKEKDPNAAKIYTIAVWIALYYNKDTGKFNIIQ